MNNNACFRLRPSPAGPASLAALAPPGRSQDAGVYRYSIVRDINSNSTSNTNDIHSDTNNHDTNITSNNKTNNHISNKYYNNSICPATAKMQAAALPLSTLFYQTNVPGKLVNMLLLSYFVVVACLAKHVVSACGVCLCVVHAPINYVCVFVFIRSCPMQCTLTWYDLWLHYSPHCTISQPRVPDHANPCTIQPQPSD